MTDADFKVPNFADVRFPVNVAADMLGLTTHVIKKNEEEMGLEVERSDASVKSRRYSFANLFDIAAYRKKKGLLGTPLPRPVTLTVHVKKGGVAKTTVSVNLAIQLGLLGYSVLLIDNDPQGDTTTMLSYDPDLDAEELQDLGQPASRAVNYHLGHIMRFRQGQEVFPLEAVFKKPFGENGPHLIPADESLDDLNVTMANVNNGDFRYGLLLEQGRKGSIPDCDLSKYDFVIFDCPPSSTVASRNALVACDYLITPVRMDRLSVKGLSRSAASMKQFELDYSRAPHPIVVPTMFQKNRPRTSRNLALLLQHFSTSVTDQRLTSSEDYLKALDEGYPVSIWKGTNPAIRAEFQHLTREIVDRIDRNESGQR